LKYLIENTFSESLPISVLEDDQFRLMLGIKDSDGKNVILIEFEDVQHFKFLVRNHVGYINIEDNQYFIIPSLGEDFLKTLIPFSSGAFFNMFDGEGNTHIDIEVPGFGKGLVDTSPKKGFDESVGHSYIELYEKKIQPYIRSGYLQTSVESFRSAGRLNIEKSKMFLFYGGTAPVWDTFIWEQNISINAGTRATFEILVGTLDLQMSTKIRMQKIMEEVCPVPVKIAIDYDALISNLDRTSSHYREFFELAKSFGNKDKDEKLSYTMLVPTKVLIQSACKNVIKKCISNKNYDLNLKFEKTINLIKGQDIHIAADITLLDKRGKCAFLGNVYAKENENLDLDLKDIFRINTLMDAYKIKHAVLIYPSDSSSNKTYTLSWGRTVTIFKLDMLSTEGFVEGLYDILEKLYIRTNRKQEAI